MAGHGRAYWADRTGPRRRKSYPRLRGSHTADVVVIGGGLTGCTAAYVLAAGGLKVVLVEAARADTGTGSAGAIRLHDAFTFDPVRAALGLAAAATGRSARIFEQSAARRTKFTRRHADVILEDGTIRTRGVLVATGGPGILFRQLRRHVREVEGHVVVTEPLTAAMRRETGRRQSLLTEAGDAPHWLRWLPDNRAVFAGAVGRPVKPRLRDRALVQRTGQLMYELSVLYPVISGLPARWGWAAPVVTGVDGLPWVGPHRNYPFHFFSLGFGWHGDGLAWFAAKAALRHFTDAASREDEVFGFERIL